MKIRSALISILVLVTAPVSASAASIMLVNDDRVASSSYLECLGHVSGPCPNPPVETQFEPPAAFADWTGDFHQSSVSTSSMAANATAIGKLSDPNVPGPNDITGQSQSFRFDITFDVVTPVEIDITGSYWFISSRAGIVLSREDLEIFRIPDSPYEIDSFDFQTLLMPGRYQLVAIADAPLGPSEGAHIDFAATFTAVPEPNTALLLGIALASFSRSRTAARHRSRAS